jgi:hypothetical protein
MAAVAAAETAAGEAEAATAAAEPRSPTMKTL